MTFEYTYAVDTAGSIDGPFLDTVGDLYVEIQSPLGDFPMILVSARYTRPDPAEAAELAVDLLYELDPGFSRVVSWPGARPVIHVTIHMGDGSRWGRMTVSIDETGEWVAMRPT